MSDDFAPEIRNAAVWSTEAAAACGLSERTTRAQLWAEKSGLVDPVENPPENVPAELGLECQDGIMRMHAKRTGDALIPLRDVSLQAEVSGVPVGSHYDAWNKTTQRLHEIKFFGVQRMSEFGEAGTDTVPMDVLLQALHEMLVWNAQSTGYGRAQACEVNVVFGNVARIVFVVPWDDAAVDKLLQKEAEFMALVKTGTAPEPQSLEDARRVWSRADGTEVIADRTALQAHQALIGLRKQLKALEAQGDEMALYLQKQMQNASVLKAPDGRVLATWREVSSERIDVKKLRAELPEVARQYLSPSVSRRFLPKG